jgi:hypothetical protein
MAQDNRDQETIDRHNAVKRRSRRKGGHLTPLEQLLIDNPELGELIGGQWKRREFPRDVIADLFVPDPRARLYNLKVVTMILDNLVNAASLVRAAARAGVAERTVWEWKETREDFKMLIDRADAEFEADVAEQIHAAVGKNWAAGAVLLERKFPKEWGRKDRIDHTVQVEGGINIAAVLMTPESIMAASHLETLLQQQEALDNGDIRELPPHED